MAMKGLLNILRLVEAPLTNRECDQFWADAEMRKWLGRSHLYMIGQRKEVFFRNYRDNPAGGITFDLVGNTTIRDVTLQVELMFPEIDPFDIDFGDKIIRVLDVTGRLLEWYTVDKLLFHYWNRSVIADGLERYREFTEYDLHYVGISKEEDSFSRLFQNGHQKRAKILSQEKQLRPDAALTDELFIFFFKVEPLLIKVHELDKPLVGVGIDETPDYQRIVADAEKAFVKILDSEYNTVKYKAYPLGDDGIRDEGLSRYAYIIGEDISFSTFTSSIRGLVPTTDFRSDRDSADLIGIEGDEVRLYRREDMTF